MPMEIAFELSDNDLEHFREVMHRARENSSETPRKEIIDNASALLDKVNNSETSDFIRDRMNQLETLIGMVVDEGWGLKEEDRRPVVEALTYFAEAEDLIPDDIPGLGFLDDAIMIEMVCRELEPEIQAYRDFVVFRAAESFRLGKDSATVKRADWLEGRRKQLQTRMRRRRRRSGDSKSSRSPFSLL
jgi:uncharacterized membrane protein YkvA (DUF1232 family)